MLKNKFKNFINYLIITLFIFSLAYGSEIKKDSYNSTQAIFVIEYDVNLYKDKDSPAIQKKVTFFDSIDVLSKDVLENGRIKVKLLDGTEGWIEEKYTSYIPEKWKKLTLLENYYCYIFTNKKVSIYKDDDKYGKMHYYSNSDIDIAMGVVLLKNYQKEFESRQFVINMQIQGGHDKKLNWNREFTIGNHKVNYIITTDHDEGGVVESIDFAKLDELSLKKYYTVAIDYMPYDSAKKKLLWRKILFSTLQSLK